MEVLRPSARFRKAVLPHSKTVPACWFPKPTCKSASQSHRFLSALVLSVVLTNQSSFLEELSNIISCQGAEYVIIIVTSRFHRQSIRELCKQKASSFTTRAGRTTSRPPIFTSQPIQTYISHYQSYIINLGSLSFRQTAFFFCF